MRPRCTVCEADWQPSCSEHPVILSRSSKNGPRSTDYLAGYEAGYHARLKTAERKRTEAAE